jgi:hypothetical protein
VKFVSWEWTDIVLSASSFESIRVRILLRDWRSFCTAEFEHISFQIKIQKTKAYLLSSFPFVNTKRKIRTNKSVWWLQVREFLKILSHYTFLSRHAWHWFRWVLSIKHRPVFAWHLKKSLFHF